MKTTKKLIALVLALAMCLSLVACGGSGTSTSNSTGNTAQNSANDTKQDSTDTGAKKKIIFFTAFIGDFGLSDMGYRAVQELAETYNMDWTLVEYGSYDAALAVNCFWDALETTHYDYFFGPAWYIEGIIDDAAKQYPDTTFIHYDVGKGVEFNEPNVYGITFAQNESSFMAAILQCLMTKNGKVGCVSTDSPILNDFSTGWLAGVKYAKKEMGLDVSWLHSYMPETSMSAVYESANVMYDNGCDFVWSISAQMLLAACQAAEEHGGHEKGYWVMGCDYDQYEYFKGLAAQDESSAVGYQNILTSITKNIAPAASAIIACVESGDGSVQPGNKVWGVYENGVGYLENENFLANVPADVQQTLKDIIAKIGAGEIKVPSYYDFNTYEYYDFNTYEAFAAYRDNPDADFQA